MKKVFVLLMAVAACIQVGAATRSEAEARQAALQLLNAQRNQMAMPVAATDLRLAETPMMPTLNQPAMYIYNIGQQGFVVVAAQHSVSPILAYSDEGNLPLIEEMPEYIRAWFARYTAEAEYMEQHPDQAVMAEDKTYPVIAALCTTRWNQTDPYNAKCPMDVSGLSVTGCVATAAAQVMKYHNYPTTGEGSHSYDWLNSASQKSTLSANFGNTTYDWANMKNSHSRSIDTQEELDAVGILMSHCGISCDMGYGSASSGAQSEDMLEAMFTYFRYDKALRPICLDYCKDTTFLNYVVYELQHNRPMYISGHTKKHEGHAFVLDGIDAAGKVHINWGWGGMSNGYFTIRNLNPDEQGTGGASSGEAFTEGVTIGTGICPNKGGMRAPSLAVDVLKAKPLSLTLDEALEFSSGEVSNLSAGEWKGRYGVLLYQDGVLIRVLDQGNLTSIEARGTGAQIKHNIWLEDYNLPDGKYRITYGARYEESNTWYPIQMRGQGDMKWDLVIDGEDATLTVNLQDDPISEPVPMSVEDINAGENHGQVQKLMQNGRIVILRGEQMFDMMGNSID